MTDDCEITVSCRVRPMTCQEIIDKESFAIEFPKEKTIAIGSSVSDYILSNKKIRIDLNVCVCVCVDV